MYIYHAFIHTLSANIMYINLNTIFCTHVEDSPTKSNVFQKLYLDFSIRSNYFFLRRLP